MRLTIKEIARIAGVHRSTVDKVLHNREGVSDGVRRKIQSIIDELEYEPNPIGRALKRQEKRIELAAILLNVDARDIVNAGLEKALAVYSGFNVSLRTFDIPYSDVEAQVDAVKTCISDGVDGIIIMPFQVPEVREVLKEAAQHGIPIITTNIDLPDSGRICFVGQNGYKAGRTAGRFMGEFLRGSGEVVIINRRLDDTGELEHYMDNRVKGFRQHIEENFPGVKIAGALESRENPETVYRNTLEALGDNPGIDGIYITCGGVIGVIRALRELGRAGDVKVVCFERYEQILELIEEGVITCTIDSELEEQGYRPCRLILDYLLYDKDVENEYIHTGIQILVKENI